MVQDSRLENITQNYTKGVEREAQELERLLAELTKESAKENDGTDEHGK